MRTVLLILALSVMLVSTACRERGNTQNLVTDPGAAAQAETPRPRLIPNTAETPQGGTADSGVQEVAGGGTNLPVDPASKVVPTPIGFGPAAWVPEDSWTREAAAGDPAKFQQLTFDSIWYELSDSLPTFAAANGRPAASTSELLEQFPLFYVPVLRTGETSEIVDGALNQVVPGGAFVLTLDSENLRVRFVPGDPGTKDKTDTFNLRESAGDMPLTETTLATFAVWDRIKLFARMNGRLPSNHNELVSYLRVQPNRMRLLDASTPLSTRGIEVWVNREAGKIRVSELNPSGRRMERLFHIEFDPVYGRVTSRGELLQNDAPELSTAGYDLFLRATVD